MHSTVCACVTPTGVGDDLLLPTGATDNDSTMLWQIHCAASHDILGCCTSFACLSASRHRQMSVQQEKAGLTMRPEARDATLWMVWLMTWEGLGFRSSSPSSSGPVAQQFVRHFFHSSPVTCLLQTLCHA